MGLLGSYKFRLKGGLTTDSSQYHPFLCEQWVGGDTHSNGVLQAAITVHVSMCVVRLVLIVMLMLVKYSALDIFCQ